MVTVKGYYTDINDENSHFRQAYRFRFLPIELNTNKNDAI